MSFVTTCSGKMYPEGSDAPYNRFLRWSKRGIFKKIFTTLAAQTGVPECLMIDSTHLKAHRKAASLRKKG